MTGATSGKRRLVLHVGMDKTGTTAIQDVLHSDRKRLQADHGIRVPRTGRWNDHSHHPFAFAAFEMNGFNRTDLDRLFRSLGREIARTDAKEVVITSECLLKLPIRKADSPFWDHLSALFDPITIVVYVRSQPAWIESRHRHSVVSGAEMPVAQLRLPFFSNYLDIVTFWADRFGRDNVVVRPSESSQFFGGDIAQDFYHAAGLPFSADVKVSARRNEAFDWRSVKFLAQVNHLSFSATCRHLLNRSLAKLRFPDTADFSFVTAEAAAEIAAAYAPSNDTIARDYLGRPEGGLFDAPLRGRWISAADQTRQLATLDDGLARTARYLASDAPATVFMLKTAIRSGLRSDNEKTAKAAETLDRAFRGVAAD